MNGIEADGTVVVMRFSVAPFRVNSSANGMPPTLSYCLFFLIRLNICDDFQRRWLPEVQLEVHAPLPALKPKPINLTVQEHLSRQSLSLHNGHTRPIIHALAFTIHSPQFSVTPETKKRRSNSDTPSFCTPLLRVQPLPPVLLALLTSHHT